LIKDGKGKHRGDQILLFLQVYKLFSNCIDVPDMDS